MRGSLHEQADLAEALWAHEGVSSTVLVAHDCAVSVAQELLARRADGTLAVEIAAVHLLNGGLYPDLHRPEPIQTALLDPEQGPRISAQLTQEHLVAARRPTFAEGFDAASESADIWRSTSRDSGQLIAHRLIRYMSDRVLHAERWVTALETTDVPRRGSPPPGLPRAPCAPAEQHVPQRRQHGDARHDEDEADDDDADGVVGGEVVEIRWRFRVELGARSVLCTHLRYAFRRIAAWVGSAR